MNIAFTEKVAKVCNIGMKYALFWFVLVGIAVISPAELIWSNYLREGAAWSLTFQYNGSVHTLLSQHVRMTEMLAITFFLWFSAYYIWRHRREILNGTY